MCSDDDLLCFELQKLGINKFFWKDTEQRVLSGELAARHYSGRLDTETCKHLFNILFNDPPENKVIIEPYLEDTIVMIDTSEMAFTLLRFKTHNMIDQDEYKGFQEILGSDLDADHQVVSAFIEVKWPEFQEIMRNLPNLYR